MDKTPSFYVSPFSTQPDEPEDEDELVRSSEQEIEFIRSNINDVCKDFSSFPERAQEIRKKLIEAEYNPPVSVVPKPKRSEDLKVSFSDREAAIIPSISMNEDWQD
jgi:hypothetical protein